MVMTAHILYPSLEADRILSEKTDNEEMLPATMSDDIVTGLLKRELGFDGIVVTEALIGGITETEKACGPNIVAGVEAILGVVKPAGKLPVDIPVYENGCFTDEICFPRGYGLS